LALVTFLDKPKVFKGLLLLFSLLKRKIYINYSHQSRTDAVNKIARPVPMNEASLESADGSVVLVGKTGLGGGGAGLYEVSLSAVFTLSRASQVLINHTFS
jgi:hypothetical protein